MSKPSIKSLINDYIETESQAYIAEVKADYLRSQAAAKALHIRVLKQDRMVGA